MVSTEEIQDRAEAYVRFNCVGLREIVNTFKPHWDEEEKTYYIEVEVLTASDLRGEEMKSFYLLIDSELNVVGDI